MLFRLLLMAAIALPVQSAPSPELSELYIVSVAISDYGPAFYYRILDVKQDGRDSTIQRVSIGPADIFCHRTTIKAEEARVRDKTPVDLGGLNNPCEVRPKTVRSALRRFHQRVAEFESMSFGVVARCGGSDVYLALPDSETVNLERLKKTNPAVARLWDLSSAITGSRFGKDDPDDLTLAACRSEANPRNHLRQIRSRVEPGSEGECRYLEVPQLPGITRRLPGTD
jgi:hypothetical protein